MPSRLRLRLLCFFKRIDTKYPKTLQESVVVDYVKNSWITPEKLAVCYGFKVDRIKRLLRDFSL